MFKKTHRPAVGPQGEILWRGKTDTTGSPVISDDYQANCALVSFQQSMASIPPLLV